MSKRGEFYSTPFWQRLRRQILDRDGWRCVPPHDGCKFKEPGSLRLAGKYKAHVHHRIDREDGGSDVPENLVSTCASFNIGEGKRRQAARARRERDREQGQRVGVPVAILNGRKLPVRDPSAPYTASLRTGGSRDW